MARAGKTAEADVSSATTRRTLALPARYRIQIIQGVLRPALNRVGRRFFQPRFGPEGAADILRRTWAKVTARIPGIPSPHPLGPTTILYLAAITCSIQEVLLEGDISEQQVTDIIEELAWLVYQRMGRLAWMLTRVRTSDDHHRLLLATRLFRRFPFGPPSYEWKDIDTKDGAVAFDCLRCAAAEYFASEHKSDLCVRTFCNLDFALAVMWRARLERGGTLAGGAERCDFRWRPMPTPRDRQ